MKPCIVPLLVLGVGFASASCDRQTTVTTPSGETATVETPSPTKQRVLGNWNEMKGKLKQQYAELTDDDLLYVEGKEEELYGRLQQRLGKTRAEVEKIIEDARGE